MKQKPMSSTPPMVKKVTKLAFRLTHKVVDSTMIVYQ
jgi:tRNA splicing ligase